MINKIDIFAMAALALTSLPAGAFTSDMVLTYAESPGATNSSLADTSIFTFKGYSNGTHVTNAVWTIRWNRPNPVWAATPLPPSP